MKHILLKSLVSLMLVTLTVSQVYAAPPTLLWSDGSVQIVDIALSKDGKYVVAAVATAQPDVRQVRFYGRSSGIPIWIMESSSERFLSVAISADGDCVAVGSSSQVGGGFVHSIKNARSLSGAVSTTTWSSQGLGGPIDRRCLDISDDGNYVVACGTGPNVFYWADAKSKSGPNTLPTWNQGVPGMAEAIDLSGDGDYIAVGYGTDVAYWKNIRTATGNPIPAWKSTKPDHNVIDVAISDDGNYVAAATVTDVSVHYWANAKILSGDPDHTWFYGGGVSFLSVDMSSNGDSVTAGAEGIDKGVYFWAGARGLTGKPQNPTWTYTTAGSVNDVVINTVGDYVAATDMVPGGPYKIHFLDRSGALKWSFALDKPSFDVSISSNGDTLAIGTSALDTAYLISTGYPEARPVGGIVVPTNKLEILTPYLALAGLVIAVSAVVVVKKRR